jgi:hypothetical protein
MVLHLAGPQVLDKVKGVSDDNEGRLFAYKEYYQTQREIIGSAHRRRASARHPRARAGPRVPRRRRHRLGGRAPREGRRQIDPIERLRELVFVEEVRGSRLLRISADYPDPQIAADIANAIADAYLAHHPEPHPHRRDRQGQHGQRARQGARRPQGRREGARRLQAGPRHQLDLPRRPPERHHRGDHRDQRQPQARRGRELRRPVGLRRGPALHKQGSLASASLLPQSERAIFEDMRSEQLERRTRGRAALRQVRRQDARPPCRPAPPQPDQQAHRSARSASCSSRSRPGPTPPSRPSTSSPPRSPREGPRPRAHRPRARVPGARARVDHRRRDLRAGRPPRHRDRDDQPGRLPGHRDPRPRDPPARAGVPAEGPAGRRRR